MSNIDVTGIDETKPVQGQPTTESVRNNFAAIKTQLSTAKTELENLSGVTDKAAARSNLELGDSATKNVGTAAGTVAAGDHNHDSVYSTTGHDHNGAYQPIDDTLQSLSALGTAADKIAYTTGVDTWAETPLTSFARTVLDDADAGEAMQTLNGVQVVNTVATLRTIAPNTSRKIWLAYHTTPGDGGHGMFRAVTGAAPGTYVDNGGTIIVPTNGDGSAAFLREYSGAVNVKWFGAKGDGVTDDTAAIQSAINYAIPLGRRVYLPAGFYVISGNGLSVLNTGAGNTGGTQSINYRTLISGDGAGASILKWTGGASKACLTIGTGSDSRSRFSGFSLLQTGATKEGYGVYLYETAHCVFDNVAALGFEYGLKAVDNFSITLNQCVFQKNTYGLDARYAAYSRPNAWTLNQCNFMDNEIYGACFVAPTTLRIAGGSFERNGIAPVAEGALKIDGNPVEGITGLDLHDVYFEKNYGNYDVGIYANNNSPGIHNIEGCTFNRVDTDFVTTNIALYKSTAARAIVRIHGNGFAGFGTYTPDASRKYIQVPTPVDSNYIVDIGPNIWGSTTEKPSVLGAHAADSRIVAAVRFNGTTATIDGVAVNVASVVRNGAGDYTINYDKALRETKNIYSVGGTETVSTWELFSEGTTSFRFKIKDATPAYADFNNISVVVYGADGAA